MMILKTGAQVLGGGPLEGSPEPECDPVSGTGRGGWKEPGLTPAPQAYDLAGMEEGGDPDYGRGEVHHLPLEIRHCLIS